MLIENRGVDIDYKQQCAILSYSAENPIDDNAGVSVPRPNDTGSVQPLKAISTTFFPANGLPSCIGHFLLKESFQGSLQASQKNASTQTGS